MKYLLAATQVAVTVRGDEVVEVVRGILKRWWGWDRKKSYQRGDEVVVVGGHEAYLLRLLQHALQTTDGHVQQQVARS